MAANEKENMDKAQKAFYDLFAAGPAMPEVKYVSPLDVALGQMTAVFTTEQVKAVRALLDAVMANHQTCGHTYY